MAKNGEVALSFALDLKKDEVILVWYSFELCSCGSESAPVLVIVVLRQGSALFSRLNVDIYCRNGGLRLLQVKRDMKRTLRLHRSKGDWIYHDATTC